MLDVTDVDVELGGRRVLAGVSLHVDPGETVALLGPSGSGKTTLLRVIAGLQQPDRGSVRLDGRDLAGVPPHRRQVGLMFQDYALFPHRSVAGNVEFGLRMRGDATADRRRRVAEVLGLVGLAGFEDRSVSELSGGERQRVALARSLAPAPRLLMLDEPLGSLDRTRRDQLVVDLAELFDTQGLTVVYVTHDQSEALALADRVAVLDEGRVVQAAEPRELWRRPATPFVARFLGFANLLPVEVVGGAVRAPFGAIGATDRPDGPATALIRPAAVRIVPASPIEGIVRSRVFRGDRTSIDVEVGEVHLEAELDGSAPAVGAPVAVAIDPAGLQLFDRRPDWRVPPGAGPE